MFSHLSIPSLRTLSVLFWGGPLTAGGAGDRRVRSARPQRNVQKKAGQPAAGASAGAVRGVEPEWQGQWRTLRHL